MRAKKAFRDGKAPPAKNASDGYPTEGGPTPWRAPGEGERPRAQSQRVSAEMLTEMSACIAEYARAIGVAGWLLEHASLSQSLTDATVAAILSLARAMALASSADHKSAPLFRLANRGAFEGLRDLLARIRAPGGEDEREDAIFRAYALMCAVAPQRDAEQWAQAFGAKGQEARASKGLSSRA